MKGPGKKSRKPWTRAPLGGLPKLRPEGGSGVRVQKLLRTFRRTEPNQDRTLRAISGQPGLDRNGFLELCIEKGKRSGSAERGALRAQESGPQRAEKSSGEWQLPKRGLRGTHLTLVPVPGRRARRQLQVPGAGAFH